MSKKVKNKDDALGYATSYLEKLAILNNNSCTDETGLLRNTNGVLLDEYQWNKATADPKYANLNLNGS
jgi:hypothetical protein